MDDEHRPSKGILKFKKTETVSFRPAIPSRDSRASSFTQIDDTSEAHESAILRKSVAPQELAHNRQNSRDTITSILSGVYAKLLIILGFVFPITQLLSKNAISEAVYQGFYLYLYITSILFVVFVYVSKTRVRAQQDAADNNSEFECQATHCQKFGSKWLRGAATIFGIGNVVSSAFEFGKIFEIQGSKSFSNVLDAITPLLRIFLVFAQTQFIFLNTSEFNMEAYTGICRFGLMHCLATNICEWLFVIVEETKHDIHFEHQEKKHNSTVEHILDYASPYCFPFTVEYSLICAIILYEMWKKVNSLENIKYAKRESRQVRMSRNPKVGISRMSQLSARLSQISVKKSVKNVRPSRTANIIVAVSTIISLILFFQFSSTHQTREAFISIAGLIVLLDPLTLAIMGKIFYETYEMQCNSTMDEEHKAKVKLDCNLLVASLYGAFVYSLFSMFGSIFAVADGKTDEILGVAMEIFEILQISIQTLLILHLIWKRSNDLKNGKSEIKFLLWSNFMMWIINVFVRNKFSFREKHKDYFTEVGWIAITHMSMPLAIFYRFHSVICLLEMTVLIYGSHSH